MDQTGVAPAAPVVSDPITVNGIHSAAVSITACTGTSCAYSIDGGGWTGAAGVVSNGASVRVRQTASPSFGTTTDLILNVGGVEDTFSVTTTIPDLIFADGFGG